MTTPIATTGLCLPDGTPLAVILERDCSGNTQQTGWMNLSTGAFTTGVPPAGAAACGDSRSIQVSGVFCDVTPDGTVHGLVLVEYHYDDAGAIDSVRLVDAATGATYALTGALTVCQAGDDESPGEPAPARQIVERCGCDDTTGDGVGDVQYVELWSVDTSGATAPLLVGTYRDGDFDQPYIPAAPVDCTPTSGDESPGEPERVCAPQIVERCGCDDPDGDGLGEVPYTELWAIDPCIPGAAPVLLGTWAEGDFDQPYTPVAPAAVCAGELSDESPGEPAHALEVAPVPLCVIDDASGHTLQNVLAEVVYDQATGERAGVRYVDAVDGSPVAVPGGAHLAVCPPPDSCRDCSTVVLCDTDVNPPATITGTAASGRLANGVSWAVTAPSAFAPTRQSGGDAWWGLALFPNPSVPLTTYTFDQPVTAEFSVGLSYSTDTTPGQNTVQLPAGAVPLQLPAGYTYDRATSVLSVDSTVTGCPPVTAPTRESTARFRVSGVSSFGLKYLGTKVLMTACKVFGSWIFGAVDVTLGGPFLRTVCRDCDGAVISTADTLLNGSGPYTPVGLVEVCQPAAPEPSGTGSTVELCDTATDGTVTPFLRHVTYTADGAPDTVTDTGMDGTSTYVPSGDVGTCTGAPCAASTTVELCDSAPVDSGALVARAATDPTPYFQTGDGVNKLVVLADPAPFWAGGSLTVDGPAGGETTADPTHRYTAAVLSLPADAEPPCGQWPDTLTLTVGVTLTNNGPAAGNGVDGRLALWNGTTSLATAQSTETPVGTTKTLAVSAPVSRDDLVAGLVAVEMDLETKHTGLKAWLASDLTISLEGDTDGCGTRFLRTIRRDCATGELVDVLDTDYDGQPYTPTEPVGPCPATAAAGDMPGCAATVEVVRLCDMNPDVPADDDGKRCATPFLRSIVFDCTGAVVSTRDTTMDGVTPYTAVTPVDCAGGVPALTEVPWNVTSIVPDPDNPTKGLIYSLSPNDDPTITGTVKVAVTNPLNATCPNTPPNYSVSNASNYLFTPDDVLKEHATYLRIDLLDFDAFEPVVNLSPRPDRLGGTAYFSGSTILPTASNGTGEMYYDGPPDQIAYRVNNTGGGVSCSTLSFAAVSLKPEGCCGCAGGDAGSGEGGPTVQQLCVAPTSDPTALQEWTRIIQPDGTTIYYLDPTGTRYDNTLPAGFTIVPCDSATPCRDAATFLLCDVDPDCTSGGTATATDTDVLPYNNWGNGPTPPNWCFNTTAGQGAPLWAGGSLVLGPDPACDHGSNSHRAVAATLAAGAAGATGTVNLTASVHVHLDGPVAGVNGDGRLGLWDATTGTRLAYVSVVSSAPVGYDKILTVTAPVDAAALAAGQIVVSLDLETYHGGSKSWTVDSFEWSADVPASQCGQQFLRKITTDCTTGAVTSVVDTLLDGTPYTAAGDVGECQTVTTDPGTPAAPCGPVQALELCDVTPDGVVPFVRHLAYDCDGLVAMVTDTGLDGSTPYTTAGNVVSCELAAADAEGSSGTPEVCTYTLPDTPTGFDMANASYPGCWVGDALNPSYAYGDRVTSWEGTYHTDASTVSNLSFDSPTLGGLLDFGAFTPTVPGDPTMSAHGYVGTATINGIDITLTDTGGIGLSHQAGNTLAVRLHQNTGFRLEFSEPVELTLTTDHFADPASDKERLCAVTAVTVPWDATKQPDGTVVDTATGQPVPDDATVTCIPGTPGDTQCCPTGETLALCDIAADGTTVPFLRRLTYTPGTLAPTVADTALDGITAYVVTGTVGVCDGPGEPDCVRIVLSACRCDDTDGDGVADAGYVELLAVDCEGVLTAVGTYTEDLAAPYTPVAPVACDTVGAEPVVSVQAHRIELAAGESWDASTVAGLRSVTLSAHTGDGLVTTADGASTLFEGESVSWSVTKEADAALTGPLTVDAVDGVITVAWTRTG
ncbi:hypothetical protein [Streptomyces fuscigenes]|uniref:hypothetical protein n=1 Tax=Streptomyces fuscigenes TaxID=1528880 RepID=UPI001F1FD4A1|nr:hypothetical protein [Streptomyces fuscigenes]MCF3960616.1 hypothetical protein [Streptomyces fuscigenes]